ncbi:hypothetical protein MMB17_02150 [Methylobacterium organophilum]|uniref:hypothetical protein n=1 Tax=Methylobacterium organophilum TaxID=410 RepID=UPI001F130E04|nr:hypothetical protein [Methylobacterium organophilum]UMY18178.1 hypothetical protein MMB17_02150 [Methylobacterium organophilum]
MGTTHSGTRRGYAVRNEVAKQVGIVAVIVALGVWQRHFVAQAAAADLYIFTLLFSAGLFGIYNAVSGTHKLANEFVALEAMKEIYEDAHWMLRAPDEAKLAQLRRIRHPAVLYNTPSVLATAYNLIVEEVQRNGSFRIPTGTMQVLVSDVETKLDDRQGMSHYLGALMVLLGLLGTFIGLMHTLESVGGILGSLDLSGSAGAGAIAGLIESLKRPLEGMSTGFGASLFGLIGSLIIGCLSKVDSKAAFRLKHEFETWISKTVQIEAAEQARKDDALAKVRVAASQSEDSQAAVRPMAEPHLRTILRVARSTVAATARLTEQTTSLTATMAESHREIARQRSLLERIAEAMEQARAEQTERDARIEAIGSGFAASQRQLTAAITRLNDITEASARASQLRLDLQRSEDGRLHDGLNRTSEGLRQITERIAALEASVAGRLSGTPIGPDRFAEVESVTDVIADLDRLIASTPLDPGDVRRLRRLSAYAETRSVPPGSAAVPAAEALLTNALRRETR